MLNKVYELLLSTKKYLSLLAISVVMVLGATTTAQAIPFNQISQIYFFGDSLTDSGFNDIWTVPVPRPVGKAPTFTTFGGYIWSQYIARDIKGSLLPTYPGPVPPDIITNNAIYAATPITGFVTGTLTGFDYAAGGSTTNSIGVIETWAPSLHQQVAFYLSTAPQTLDPNAVYFIWSGANDILALIFSAPPLPTQTQLILAASNAATNIASEVALLSARGAKRIVVMSLPNIGYTPLITDLASSNNLPTLPASIKTVTYTFNSLLNQKLGGVIAKTGVKVLYIDVYTLLDNVIAATKVGQPYVVAGQSFKFVNYSSPACATVPTSIYCPSTAPTNYVFADSLHPSDMAHRLLSLYVESKILAWK